ncbi:hypothetical protein CEXT_803261 [Caerostris extrusa]|uniref:Uncharacterized protein n=1 Tax=Caerostris extrusa TaxID=172846 RepID=A0AAV4R3A7_CAEEX|nr:hypothetical protein CEXT_803261 [Caerostris extrusa]
MGINFAWVKRLVFVRASKTGFDGNPSVLRAWICPRASPCDTRLIASDLETEFTAVHSHSSLTSFDNAFPPSGQSRGNPEREKPLNVSGGRESTDIQLGVERTGRASRVTLGFTRHAPRK